MEATCSFLSFILWYPDTRRHRIAQCKTHSNRTACYHIGAIFQDKLNPGETDDPFLGAVREDKKLWVMDVQLNKIPMEFHIDAGAKVTIIS